MAGRQPTPMHEFDSTGKIVERYETLTEVQDKYYKGAKYPVIREGKVYGVLPNGNFIARAGLPGKEIVRQNRIDNSRYVRNPHKGSKASRPIAAYNIIGQKIATFSSLIIAAELTKMPISTIFHSLEANPSRKKKYAASTELIFRYDDEVVSL